MERLFQLRQHLTKVPNQDLGIDQEVEIDQKAETEEEIETEEIIEIEILFEVTVVEEEEDRIILYMEINQYED